MQTSGMTIVDKEASMQNRCKFHDIVIASAGYDAQCELLEIEFCHDGQVWQYCEVPEDIWYRFKFEENPELFFHRYIKGRYVEQRVLPRKAN